MSTERQQQASRANGAKSRGPVTPAGKLSSSHNAMTHGMLSGTIVLKDESSDRFLSLLAALHEEFQPQTPFEESLIDNMAVARWRQLRIWGLEKAGMDYEVRRQSELPCSPSNSTASEDAATRASRAFRTLSDDGRSIELINRYDSRYERQYYRAHRRFLEVHDRRTPPSSSRPERSTFPDGGGETPVPGKHVISKGTREVLESKRTLSANPSRPRTRGDQPRSSKATRAHASPTNLRHRVPRLCPWGTRNPTRPGLNLIKSASENGPQHAFPQAILPMSRFLGSSLVGIILVLWACCSAAAATLQQLSMDQMAQSATAIVRARVTGSSASFTGSTIYTHYKLQVSETWKGVPGTEVMLPGGVAGGYRQSFPGVPSLEIGAEYVLYLWKSSTTGIIHIVGLSQGIFNVTQQADGSIQVGRPAIGETMLDAAGHPAKDHAVQMQLSDMKAHVVQAGAIQ